MAKRKSSTKITQREESSKRRSRADVIKLGKFKPLRVAEIPQEKIQQATQVPGGEEAPSTAYPENAPEAADNPQAVITPEQEPPKTKGGEKPGEAEEPEETPAPGEEGGPARDQAPPEDQEKGKEPEAREKKPEEAEGRQEPENEGGKKGKEGEGEGDKEGKEDKKKEGEAEKEAEKGIKALAKAAWQAISKVLMSALTSLASAVGLPVIIGCAVVALIILIILGVLAAHWMKTGPTGRTAPIAAGVDDPNVKKIISLMESGDKKLEIASDRDKEFIKSGKIDKRLAAALAYLADHHEHIRVSHIVSGYEDIKTNTESGRFHDIKYPNNISAHKQGQAADIDEIDYVMGQCNCGDKIPVQVKWQTIGENPFAEGPPDALNKIKGPDDFANEDVKTALEKFGVKGLDQPDLVAKMKASQVLSKIDSPYDLTDPNVITEFEKIGVTGLNNDSLQAGLKRVQALQTLSEMDIHDIEALRNPQVQSLLALAGVPVTEELIAELDKMQTMKIVQSINSLDDLNNPDVQAALAKLGVNINDPKFKDSLNKMAAANTISNWRGDINDPTIRAALATFGLEPSTDLAFALSIIQANKNTFGGGYNELNNDISTIETLEQLAIFTGNPDMQKVIQQFRAAQMIKSGTANWGDPGFLNALSGLGLTNSADDQTIVNKFQAANYIISHQGGDYNDPRYQAALATLGVGSDEAFAMANRLINISEYSNLNDPALANDLAKLGLKDPKYYDSLEKVGALSSLSQIHDLSDLNNPGVQNSLQSLGIDDPGLKDGIGKLGSLQTIAQINDLEDLQNPYVQDALRNLGIKDSAISNNLATLGSIETLLSVRSPWDLANPQVAAALSNLGINVPDMGGQLSQAGSIMALTQVKTPADLLQPGNLAALDTLGVINLDAQMLGQLGALQALMQVDSLQDLMNPNSILALNALGILSLSNPVTMALMIVSFLDNLFGGSLLGGLFGGDDCKATTDCYKPTAQENVYKVVEELLQMPYDLGDKNLYRVTQLIVWKLDYIKQKDPNLTTKLDQLYWTPRAKNVGLFTMPEAFANIHIGY